MGKSLGETGKTLKALQMEGMITLEVQEELIGVKFFGAIEKRMMEVSKKVYLRMNSEFNIERNLLDYLFSVFKQGSSSCKNFFHLKSKQRLSMGLKTYALAEPQKIPKIFDSQIVERNLEPIRGVKKDHEEITAVFYHLLKENKEIFLKNEVKMCKGEGRKIAGEYVTHCIVKTMCGKPPKKVSLFDLNIRNCNIEFNRMDYFILLKLAEKVLLHYLKSN